MGTQYSAISGVFDRNLRNFIKESNRIEGITLDSVQLELHVQWYRAFLRTDDMSVDALIKFVNKIQPNAKFRDKPYVGQVYVGDHTPPPSGPHIREDLEAIIKGVNLEEDPWKIHIEYETLHPFTDGNGRSGRMLWAWQMINQHDYDLSIGFLHLYYYQTLSGIRKLHEEAIERD